METETPNQTGRRLGDFEASPHAPIEDIYEESRRLLHTSRRQSQPRQPQPPSRPSDSERMEAQDSEDTKPVFGYGIFPMQPSAARGSNNNTPNTSSNPFVIDDSPYSTPIAEARGAKRAASPSLEHTSTVKRQQTRHNTPVKMSPSRPLSSSPFGNMFGTGIDHEEQQVGAQHRETSGCGGETSFTHGAVQRSRTRSVNGGGRSGRQPTSHPSSARQTPSRQYAPSAQQIPYHERISTLFREDVSPAQQTPSRGYHSSAPQTSSREYSTSQQQHQTPSKHHLTPQQPPPRKDIPSYPPDDRGVGNSLGKSEAMGVSCRPEALHLYREIGLEEHDMESEAEVMERPLSRAASMMREIIRGQSRPPHRSLTVPPESMRDQPLYEQSIRANVSRSVRSTRSGQQQRSQEVKPHSFSRENMDKIRHASQQPSRHRTPQPAATSDQFILDSLAESSNSETEDQDMTSFFRAPQRKQQELRDRQQSTQPPNQRQFRRAQTVAPENSQPGNYQNKANTPETLQNQSEHDKYVVESLHLQSPIWSPGADHRVTVSVQRPRTPSKSLIGTAKSFHDEPRGRSRSVAPQTLAIDRVRGQSQYGSASRNARAKSQAREYESREISESRVQTRVEESIAFKSSTTPQLLQRRTPNRAPRDDKPLDDDSPDVFHTPMDKLLRKYQQQPQKSQTLQNGNVMRHKISGVIPSGSAFTKKPKPEPHGQVTPKKISSSGRGFADPDIIDLVTPEGPPRSIPMNKRLTPVAKKLPPKKPVTSSANHPKPFKPIPPPKKVAKEKPAPIDPEEVRQQRAAEIIIDRKQKSDETSMQMALFGEVIHDQAAEDKKAEEARAKGQREREAKMARMIAAESDKNRVAEEEKKQKQEDAIKRKEAKQAEEEQKKVKREAERKRQLAHENREKEILRRAAEEKIRADREKQAKEEALRELEKKKAKEKAESVQAAAEELAKRRLKQEEAKAQAASLSAAKVSSIPDLRPVEKPVVSMEYEDSLFMPEVSPVVPGISKPDDRPRAKASNSNGMGSQISTISAFRAEKEAEDLRKKIEMAKRTREKLDLRYNRVPAPAPAPATNPPNPSGAILSEHRAPRPESSSQLEPIVKRSKPASTPELVPAVDKPAPAAPPAKAPPAPKKDRPAPAPDPKPKAKPAQKPSITQTKISDSFASQSSSSSGDAGPALGYLDRLATNNVSKRPSKSFSAFTKPKNPPAHQYKNKVKLISDLEREALEKKQKKRVRAPPESYKLTEKQKQDASHKRTEKAKEKRAQQILEEAEKNGVEMSEETLNAQLEAFVEKRAQELQKRAENKARKEQDPSQSLGSRSLSASDENLTPAQQILRDADLNGGLSHEELEFREQLRERRAAKVAAGKIRNNRFDKAAAKKFVSDSEESEEDPDPDPEVDLDLGDEADGEGEAILQQESTEDGDEGESWGVDSSSESESEDDTESMSPMPEMSASFKSRATAADREARKKRVQSLNLHSQLPDGGAKGRIVNIYQVWKLELTKEVTMDGEYRTEEHMVEQFTSLDEANMFALRIVEQQFRSRPYTKLEECYKEGKFRAIVAHDDKHESQINIVEMPVGSSDISPEVLAAIPKRIPERFWDVMQYTSQRVVDEDTGIAAVCHYIPKRHGQFSVREMANHEACEKLIAMFKPAGANIEHVTFYQTMAKHARELRDQHDADGECFEAEVDRETIPEWMGYDKIRMIVQCVEIQGPLN